MEIYRKGWTRFDRKRYDNFLYKEERPLTQREAFEDLYNMANFEDSQCEIDGTVFTVKRGQVLCSIKSLSHHFRWNYQPVRTFIKKLTRNGLVFSKGVRKATLITIIDYEVAEFTNEQLTSRQRAANEQLTTLKEVNKLRSKEKVKTLKEKNIKKESSDPIDFSGIKKPKIQESLFTEKQKSSDLVVAEKLNGTGKTKNRDRSPLKAKKEFVPPSIAELQNYCSEKGIRRDCVRFWNHYEGENWVIHGRNGDRPMKNWKNKIQTWDDFKPNGNHRAAFTTPVQDAESGREFMKKLENGEMDVCKVLSLSSKREISEAEMEEKEIQIAVEMGIQGEEEMEISKVDPNLIGQLLKADTEEKVASYMEKAKLGQS